MTTDGGEARVAETRYVPWLARFRRTGRGGAELQLERVDDDTPDPRASTAALDGLKVAARGMLFEREELARELGLESLPEGDAELVLYAYRRWGQEGIRRLRGIFDVFIWDGERECLLAARDHSAPNRFSTREQGRRSCSRLRRGPARTARRSTSAEPRRACGDAVLGLAASRGDLAEGIRRILPGHILTVTNAQRLEPVLEPVRRTARERLGDAEELMEFDALLERSVSQCLELGSCGIFLSGGLDSVSIAAVALDIAKRRGSRKPLAFSLAFPTRRRRGASTARRREALGLPQIMLGLEESVAPDGLVRRALDLSADWPLPRTFSGLGPYYNWPSQAPKRASE